MITVDSKSFIQALRHYDPAADLVEMVRRVLWDRLQRHAPVPDSLQPFHPGRQFEPGDWIGIDGSPAHIVAVRERGNPRQGGFSTLDLEMPDGSRRRLASRTGSDVQDTLLFAIPDSVVNETLSMHRDALCEAYPRLQSSWASGPRASTAYGGPLDFRGKALPPPQRTTIPQVRPIRFLSDAELAQLWSEHPEWESSAHGALSTFLSLWGARAADPHPWTQNALLRGFIRPLFEALGWSPVCTDDPHAPNHKTSLPCSRWALYPDDVQRQAFEYSRGSDDADLAPAMIMFVLDAGYRSDSEPDAWTFNDLALSMITALMSTGVSWGGITDGRRWRFYSRRWDNPDIGSTAAEFYEIDLRPIVSQKTATGTLNQEAWQSFQRWWLLWRRDSYIPAVQGQAPLDLLQERAAAERRRVVQRFQDSMLARVLPALAGGFVAYRRQALGIRTETSSSLEEIAGASLSLAYALLFIMYAETRGLLPMDDPAYRASSLLTLIHRTEDMIRRQVSLSLSVENTPLYERVWSLFRQFSHGAPELSLLRIEVGLFDETTFDQAFLERHRLSDHAIAHALQALSMDGDAETLLACMDLRHLCIVGEGLLKNALWVVDAALGEVAWVDPPTDSRQTAVAPVADYVTVSAVEDALSPVLAARARDFKHAMDHLVRLRQRESERRGAQASPAVRARIAQAEDRVRQALMGVKILDPAMGAGHFLVAAADVVTDWIVSQYRIYHRNHPEIPEYWDPILRLIVETRHRVRHQMSMSGLHLDPQWPEDLAIIASQVAQTSLYGVDVDPVAVNLAQANLSLWVFARGGALTAPQPHLRQGNSLLGVRLRDLHLSSRRHLDLIGGVSSLGARNQAPGESGTLLPLEKAVLDLWISRFVGNDEAGLLLDENSDLFECLDQRVNARPASLNRALARAEELSDQKGFVHWDLIFPGVFYDPRRRGRAMRAGFDVVIGSPPNAHADDERVSRRLLASIDGPRAATRTGSSPFEMLARRLVRAPGGRIALVMIPKPIQRSGR